MKFANWDAHCVLKSRSELDIILPSLHLDMFCITETRLTPDRIWQIPGYITHISDRLKGRGDGSVITVKRDLLVSSLHLRVFGLKIKKLVL